jgi:TolB-like protein
MRKLQYHLIVAAIGGFFLVPLVAYEQQLRELAVALATEIGAAGKKSAAVVDFTDLQGNVTELGRFLAEELSVKLSEDARGKGFNVVDRGHLRTLLQEHKLTSSGLLDPQTAKKLGQIAGVDVIVTGSITAFGDSVRLSAKAMDVSTAQLVKAMSVDIPKTKAIEELMARGIGTVSTQSLGTAAQSPSGGPPVVSGNKPVSSTTRGFVFELESCRRSGTTVRCSLFVRSLLAGPMRRTTGGGQAATDRYLSIWGRDDRGGASSRVFDEGGNEYAAVKVRLASEENNGAVGVALPRDSATRSVLWFDDVPVEVTGFKTLDISAAAYPDGALVTPLTRMQPFRVELRHIAILPQ